MATHTARAALVGTLLLAGCNQSDSLKVQSDRRPKVLTTFTVLADLARNVAGDRLLVRSIVKPGAEIHGYQPTPSDLEQAVDADLIIENGLGLELWSKRFTSNAKHVPTVTLSDGMEPLLIEEDAYAGKPNPHAWMSPKRTMDYVDRLVACPRHYMRAVNVSGTSSTATPATASSSYHLGGCPVRLCLSL